MDVLAFLTLDIQRPNISAIVYGMQGDRQSRAIRAQLVDGSTQWTPPAGTFFVISYAKPDGTHGMYSQTETGNAAVTVSESAATIALAEQVLTVAGDVPMTLTMFNADGARLAAFTWLLIVKPAAYSDAAFMSTDYYNLLTEQIAAVLKAKESIGGLTATATTLAAGSAATVTVTGGTGAEDPFNFEFGIPKGATGSKGATGTAAKINAQIVEYQSGTSGTTAPTGAWSTTVPAVPNGQYLWTRTTVTFNSGSPVVAYSVSRMGVDGTGSVKTVNNQSPDSNGDILLSSSNIPTPNFSSVTAALDTKANSTDVTLEKLGAASNPNLLNNWWFATGIVNPREVTALSVGVYDIPCWKLESGTASITSDGVVLNGVLAQKLEFNHGSTLTASVVTQAGSATANYTGSDNTFRVSSNGGTVKFVKLEQGNKSTANSTTQPDTSVELLKCQRYKRTYKAQTANYDFLALGFARSSTTIQFNLPINGMRQGVAAIAFSSLDDFKISKSGITASDLISVAAITGFYRTSETRSFTVTASGLTVGQTYMLLIGHNGYIEFTNEL